MTDQAGTATETGTGTAIIIYVYKMQAGSKGKRRQGQQMGGRGCGDSQRQVSVHWQLCTSSSSSSINVQPVAPRPISRCWAYCAPNRTEPNRTELPSNRDQQCNRIRQQFRGQTASGDAATDSFWMLYAGHGPAWSTSSGRGRSGLKLLQASSASAASTRARSTFNKQF